MCADKPAGVRDGTEVFALGGFTETLPKRAGEEHGGIQMLFLTSPANFCRERKWIRAFLSVSGERPFQRALYVAFHRA
jgi:hypothetical protein